MRKFLYLLMNVVMIFSFLSPSVVMATESESRESITESTESIRDGTEYPLDEILTVENEQLMPEIFEDIWVRLEPEKMVLFSEYLHNEEVQVFLDSVEVETQKASTEGYFLWSSTRNFDENTELTITIESVDVTDSFTFSYSAISEFFSSEDPTYDDVEEYEEELDETIEGSVGSQDVLENEESPNENTEVEQSDEIESVEDEDETTEEVELEIYRSELSTSSSRVQENVAGSTAVSYTGRLSGGYSIDSLPWGTSGYQTLYSSSQFAGQTVQVTRQSGSYLLISQNNSLLGWVDRRAVSPGPQRTSSGHDVNYTTIIGSGGFSIDSLPWGYNGHVNLDMTNNYLNQEVRVVQESRTREYLLVEHNGSLLGWIDRRAMRLPQVGNTIHSREINEKVTIKQTGYSIDTLPWEIQGSQYIAPSNRYIGDQYQAIRETNNGNYILLQSGDDLLGWIDRRAVSPVPERLSNGRNVNYTSTIHSGGYSIDSRPWGTSGSRYIESSSRYIGETVQVVQETSNGNYVLVEHSGNLLGWIDRRVLPPTPERVSNAVNVNYTSTIGSGGYSIDSRPWGTSGSRYIASSSNYVNERVRVIQETSNGNYVLMEHSGDLLGWVDRKALRAPQLGNLSQSREANYIATVVASGYSIDTLPWGTTGYQTITRSNDYINQQVRVIRQTNNGHYALIELNGRRLGWIDTSALNRTIEPQIPANALRVDYTTTVNRSGYSLDSLPWGMSGFENMGTSSEVLNQRVRVIYESGSYALIEVNGVRRGWIDRAALAHRPQPRSHSAQQSVYYNTTLRSGFSIDSLPWGQSGYEQISRTDYYQGETARVTRITRNYAFIQINGRDMGWVDRRAIGTPIIYIDPGHGGSDPGPVRDGVSEAQLNLSTSLILRDILEARGYEVHMSRTNDTFPTLNERGNQANSLNASLFISIHYNAMGEGYNAARGIETFIQNFGYTQNPNDFDTSDPRIATSYRYADEVQSSLIRATGLNDRGVRGQNLNVLRRTEMSAVLLELGFMDNREELALIRTRAYQESAAAAIADSVDRYFLRY